MTRVLAMLVLLLAFVASRDVVQLMFAAPHVCDEVVTIGNVSPDDEGCPGCDQAADADNDDDVCVSVSRALPAGERLVSSGVERELNGAPAPEPGLRPPV